MTDDDRYRRPRRRTLALLGAMTTALFVAIATALGGGLGTKALDAFEQDPPLVSSSASEQVNDCGTPLFVPNPTASAIAGNSVDTGRDWSAFRRRTKAAVADKGVVVVSIQGESSRTITLTGVDFEVRPHRRPAGAVFANPCGDSVTGRFLQVDLDRHPAAIVSSTRDPKGQAGGEEEAGQSSFKPIRFPWTVSITDPLLLNIIATTRRCDCNWRAYINWRSGGRSGRIAVDNRGAGYTVVGIRGVDYFISGGPRRDPWRRLSVESGRS
jgi:hypothetical protein